MATVDIRSQLVHLLHFGSTKDSCLERVVVNVEGLTRTEASSNKPGKQSLLVEKAQTFHVAMLSYAIHFNHLGFTGSPGTSLGIPYTYLPHILP